jgi:hypothetical protein
MGDGWVSPLFPSAGRRLARLPLLTLAPSLTNVEGVERNKMMGWSGVKAKRRSSKKSLVCDNTTLLRKIHSSNVPALRGPVLSRAHAKVLAGSVVATAMWWVRQVE